MKPYFLLSLPLLLGACHSASNETYPVEIVREAPLQLDIAAQGRLRAKHATPLLVPGRNWTQQQLIWLIPDGSQVRKGDVIARFSSAQNELNLTEALLDIERTQLTRAAKQDSLEGVVGRVDVDLAQVGSQLAIANRYADADLDMFARNDILDAIEDQRFLTEKDGTLRWRQDQAEQRGNAELAVIDSQRATYEHNAQLRRQDLDSLKLIAPHDGVLVLESDWSGEKPSVGSTLWAQDELGNLPDTSSLEVEISVPQGDAQYIAKEMRVTLYPVGQPQQHIESTLSFVANTTQVESRDSPVRYLRAKAAVDPEAVQRFGWVPGMAFHAIVHPLTEKSAISLPNVAIVSSGVDQHYVYLLKQGKPQKSPIQIGLRGPARTQVLSGLNPGDQIVLLPDTLNRPSNQEKAP